jgi:RHS repeat-associated protein
MSSGVLNSITQATFAYDADELRIAKANALTGHITHYVYDADGQLIAEMDAATGNAIREYLWLGGLPVGYVDRLGAGGASRLFFIHADHLARPQKITDASRAVVWDGVFAPFGEVHAVTGSIVNVLMFPGQVYDPETGLSQNWHRDYDANIGRYLSSDPIGLEGGFNTYAYANANPVVITDPTGEVGLGGAGIGVAIGILTDEDGCYAWQELVRDAVLGAAGDIGFRAALRVGGRALPFLKRFWRNESGAGWPYVRGGQGNARGAAALRPYGGPGGGHHIPASSAFRGAAGYDAKAALAIPNSELARLGVSHSAITGAQMTGYRALAKSGAPLTWNAVAAVETKALMHAGLPAKMAHATVGRAIQDLQRAGWRGLLVFHGDLRMHNRDVEKFAELLVHHVRDAAIRNCDSMLQLNSTAPVAKRWRGAGLDPKSVRAAIPDIVDEVLFCFLRAVDEGGMPLKFSAPAGNEVDLVVDGMSELAGWYMGSGGWRTQHSRERFVDDFRDLT